MHKLAAFHMFSLLLHCLSKPGVIQLCTIETLNLLLVSCCPCHAVGCVCGSIQSSVDTTTALARLHGQLCEMFKMKHRMLISQIVYQRYACLDFSTERQSVTTVQQWQFL